MIVASSDTFIFVQKKKVVQLQMFSKLTEVGM